MYKMAKKKTLLDLFLPRYYILTEGEDCEIQFAESVLLPAAQAYRQDRPDYDPNYDDPDDILQFYIALDVRIDFNINIMDIFILNLTILLFLL